MYIQSCCQRAYIRCHPKRSTTKKEAMMQKANVSHGSQRWTRL
jgi:hypothetical protein